MAVVYLLGGAPALIYARNRIKKWKTKYDNLSKYCDMLTSAAQTEEHKLNKVNSSIDTYISIIINLGQSNVLLHRETKDKGSVPDIRVSLSVVELEHLAYIEKHYVK